MVASGWLEVAFVDFSWYLPKCQFQSFPFKNGLESWKCERFLLVVLVVTVVIVVLVVVVLVVLVVGLNILLFNLSPTFYWRQFDASGYITSADRFPTTNERMHGCIHGRGLKESILHHGSWSAHDHSCSLAITRRALDDPGWVKFSPGHQWAPLAVGEPWLRSMSVVYQQVDRWVFESWIVGDYPWLLLWTMNQFVNSGQLSWYHDVYQHPYQTCCSFPHYHPLLWFWYPYFWLWSTVGYHLVVGKDYISPFFTRIIIDKHLIITSTITSSFDPWVCYPSISSSCWLFSRIILVLNQPVID